MFAEGDTVDIRTILTVIHLFHSDDYQRNVLSISEKAEIIFDLFCINDGECDNPEESVREMTRATLTASQRQLTKSKWHSKVESVVRRVLSMHVVSAEHIRKRFLSSPYIIEALLFTRTTTQNELHLCLNNQNNENTFSNGDVLNTIKDCLFAFGMNDQEQLEFLEDVAIMDFKEMGEGGEEQGKEEEVHNSIANGKKSDDTDDEDNDDADEVGNDSEDEERKDSSSNGQGSEPEQVPTRPRTPILYPTNHLPSPVYGKRSISKPQPSQNSLLRAQGVKQVAAGNGTSYLLSAEGMLYFCGDGQNLRMLPFQSPVKKVWAGFGTAFILTADNSLYAHGSDNSHGQHGTGSTVSNIHTPEKVDIRPFGNDTVAHVAVGESHSVFRTERGLLFACGKNESQCGVSIGWPLTAPHVVDIPRDGENNVKKVACGKDFTIVLSESGRVYACGNNALGAIGMGEELPEPVEFLTELPLSKFEGEPIKDIEVGVNHSVFLTESGLVFACGSTAKGKLGIGRPTRTPINYRMRSRNLVRGVDLSELQQRENETLSSTFSPRLLTYFDSLEVIRIACGEDFTLFQTRDESLYGCGNFHMLGVGEDMDFLVAHQPVKICGLGSYFDMVAGFTHTILLKRGDKQIDNMHHS